MILSILTKFINTQNKIPLVSNDTKHLKKFNSAQNINPNITALVLSIQNEITFELLIL